MKYLIIFTALVSFSCRVYSTSSLVLNEGKNILGVLVQVDSEKSLDNEVFKSLKKRYSLEQKNFFPSLQTVSLRLKAPTNSSADLLRFCSEVKKIPTVKHCELDRVLKEQCETDSDSGVCTPTSKPLVVLSKEFNTITEKISCEIVPHSPDVTEREGLSPFWAQEYTGADLVREKLQTNTPPLKIPANLVGIWDTSSDDHGSMVGHIIMGPKASALIPAKNIVPHHNLEKIDNTADYIRAYQNFTTKCSQQKNCPMYINNSMIWEDSTLIEKAVEKISKTTVFVTSAGNEPSLMEEVKRKASSKITALTVASLHPSGLASNFTGFAPEVTISAPSDNLLLSYDKNSTPIKFGGTSGAAPQVTAALAAFTVITGYPLSSLEAKNLLEKTAIKLPHYPRTHGLGGGMLNSYKIAEVASKLAKACEGGAAKKSICISEKLQENESYLFKIDTQNIVKNVNNAFPECFNNKIPTETQPICNDRKKVFKELRKAALLNQSEPTLWKNIACISQLNGMDKNAEFYNSLAKRENADEAFLIKELIKNKEETVSNNESLFEYILSQPEWSDHPKLIEQMVQIQGVNWKIPPYLLKHPGWINHPELISKIIQGGKNDKNIVKYVLSQPGWSDHPELVSRLMQKSSESNVDEELSEYVLSKSEWIKHPELVSKLIDKGAVNDNIVSNILSKPEWRKYPDLVSKIIEKNGSHSELAIYVFSNPIWADRPDLLKKLIQSLKSDNTRDIAEYALSKPHWKDHPEFVHMLIDASGFSTYSIAQYVLSQPHWVDHPELVERLIKRNKVDGIAEYVLSRPHWRDHPELVELIIQKGGNDKDVEKYVLTQSFWKDILKKRLGIEKVTLEEIRKRLPKDYGN